MKLPRFVQIEPVGQCNLRCQMCPIIYRKDGPPYGPPAFIDFDFFTNFVDQLDDLQELHLQGLGEPLMHPRFFEMVRYATARGIHVTTNTNLTLLNERRASECVSSGLHRLHVSIDAASPEVYERIRIRSRFETIMRNLRILQQVKNSLGASAPVIQLVVVAMKQNLHELPRLVELAANLGLEEVFVQHLSHDFGESSLPDQYRPMRDFVNDQTLLHEEQGRIDHYFSIARDLAKQSGIKLRLPRSRPKEYAAEVPGKARCDWPWRGIYMSYEGKAMPCCMVATPDRSQLGDFTKGAAEQVWNGEAYNEFRRRLESDNPPDVCKSCSLYKGIF